MHPARRPPHTTTIGPSESDPNKINRLRRERDVARREKEIAEKKLEDACTFNKTMSETLLFLQRDLKTMSAKSKGMHDKIVEVWKAR
jgi:hypothetical protein